MMVNKNFLHSHHSNKSRVGEEFECSTTFQHPKERILLYPVTAMIMSVHTTPLFPALLDLPPPQPLPHRVFASLRSEQAAERRQTAAPSLQSYSHTGRLQRVCVNVWPEVLTKFKLDSLVCFTSTQTLRHTFQPLYSWEKHYHLCAAMATGASEVNEK